ncbi:MAG: hypothetical protein HDR28_07095 [Lachnospiraceae bacterium]|nr:hypothetical protein [Lachnospiraceae bacterium]
MADNGRKITKYRRPLNLNIGMLIFAAIFIYVIVCVFTYFKTEHIVGYSVKEGSLSSNSIYKGIALRTEEVVTSNNAGYVNYFAREGERAAVGNLVYTVDETGRLSDYIHASESGENSLSDADLSELKTEITSFTSRFDRAEFLDVYNFKYSVEGTVLKLSNYNILENASALNDATGTAFINYRYAAKSGIITYYIDGYENLKPEDMTAEHFDPKLYEKKHLVNNELIAKGDPVYKLSTNEDWSIVIKVDDEDIVDQLVEKEVVEVKFLKNQYTSWGTVATHTNEAGDTLVSLTFTNSMITFCNDRFIDIELLLEDEKGLKIPNSAIVEKEFFIVPREYVTKGGNSGKDGVLLETYDEEGSAATEFVPTTIYDATDTEYYLDDSVLRAGNYIVKPESTEKYAISKTGSLSGVYNINKGYADFKQVNVLYKNEEYSIVRSNTVYGLNVYDHIVLDASMVNDNQFIYE